MRKLILIVMIAVFGGCAAPQEVIVLHEKSRDYIIGYQNNITEITSTAVDAYKTSETKRWTSKYYELIDDLAALDGGKLKPSRVKLATKMFMNKLQKIDDNVLLAHTALAEASQDIEAILAMHKAMDEYLKQSGIQPEHLAMLRGQLSQAAESFIESRRKQQIIKMETAITKLKSQISEGGEEFDATAALAELKEKERAVDLLRNLGDKDDKKSELDNDRLEEIKKLILDELKKRNEPAPETPTGGGTQ